MMNRTKLLAFCMAALCVTTVGLTRCGGKSADRQVVIYTTVDQVYSEPILKAYEARTGVRVKAVYDVEAAKTTGLVKRLEAEKTRPQADVFWNGEFAQTIGLAEKGVLEVYRSPSAGDIPAEFKDPEGRWAGAGGRARIFIVNTHRLKAADYPATLQDMLDPRWPADAIGMANPMFGTMATQAAALYATRGAEPSLKFFKALRERGVRVLDGNSVVRDLVANGQLAFGLTDTDDAAEAIQRGAPVKVIAPDQGKEGTLVIPGTVAMVAGAPHPVQARALIDHLLSAAAEAELMRLGGCQTSLRSTGAVPGQSAFKGIKAMTVTLPAVQAMLPRALAELRELYVR